MKEVSDNNSLSRQIPAWVRVYGFGSLLLLMMALIGFSFFFEIKRVASVKIISFEEKLFVKCDLIEFEPIRTLDTVELELKSGRKLGLILRMPDASFDGNNMRIPATVISSSTVLPSKDEIFEEEAYIAIEKSTLLSKVFEKAKPRI